jgi:divalent metal cation (Fe/Co/Zn/Cd) transporter
VLEVERVRARQSGNRLFADLRLVLESNIPLEHAQTVVGRVEHAIRQVYPAADVIADAVPHVPAARDVVQRVRSVAHRENFQVHDVIVFETRGRMKVDLDLEVDPNIRFTEAHDRATDLERAIRSAVPQIEEVNVHIEPMPGSVAQAREAKQARSRVERRILEIARGLPGVVDCHSVDVHQIGRAFLATVHCTLQPDLSVTRVHDITEELELRVREEFREGIRVSIHPEPAARPQ